MANINEDSNEDDDDGDELQRPESFIDPLMSLHESSC